ncbi:metalloreductase transmembrane component [Exophiala viscosa]|uniref:ferric-chelate reductase (NADPH) n=1 Tax=Exophiala viscosa TaxID=2486360 RepID=A0AAN6DWP4_9EURO|nr:metalloreductase transmembrane component [Exophiala viscosa]
MPLTATEAWVRLTGREVDFWLTQRTKEELVKRVNIPINSTTPPALIQAIQHDPFNQAGKYGLLFVYVGIILVVSATLMRLYYYWGDKIRTALYKEEVINSASAASPYTNPSPMYGYVDYELPSATTVQTEGSSRHFFPAKGPLIAEKQPHQAAVSAIAPLNNTIAFFRWIFYRPIPALRIGRYKFTFPSLGAIVIVTICLTASLLYCFLPSPLFYASMSYGSPPLAIRAGMMSISLVPWCVVLATKANPVSLLTGIGHDRLIVLHRWTAYLCSIFAVIHAVPYWYQSIKDPAGFATFKLYFSQQYYIYTTGIAAIAPLIFLTLHSLPILRAKMYELFAILHIPVAWAFIGLLFWHCNNYLRSWAYLYSTVVLMVVSLLARLFFLNWTNPFRSSWLIGEESAITILPENAIKVTIPTQKRWRPGQYAYLRMPGIAALENHPFTIASLCSEDFPSQYGEQYRDMTLVFRPFSGFTRKALETAVQKGPYKTYRAFVEGPYGGMQRQMASFDQVVFFAGGSGITAIASQLLDLIKRMRDGKATTAKVHVIWAMKRPDIMEWFKEELRICRECAPPGSVQCHFYITATTRYETLPEAKEHRLSGIRDKITEAIHNPGSKRSSAMMNMDQEPELKREFEDQITALPQAYLAPPRHMADSQAQTYFPPPPTKPGKGPSAAPQARDRASQDMSTLSQAQIEATRSFDFGFPQTPTKFQKNLMRFAFLPTSVTANKRDGWRTEYGRPDIPYMLKGLSKEFGRRTCVYVCGPPEMRTDVASTVARLQRDVWTDSGKDEIFLYAENYAI